MTPSSQELEPPENPVRFNPLPEVLLLLVCGTICDCEDDDLITASGEADLPILRCDPAITACRTSLG